MSYRGFDRSRLTPALLTRRIGRHLVVRPETTSTNDDAWDLLAAGAPDGAVVVADAQTRGRGRAGRAWSTPRGQGLALSVLLHLSCDPNPLATLPLVAGLALAEALEGLGVPAALKWPNDLLLAGRKLAGILCETRRSASGIDAAVVGVGVNVSQRERDFPPELRDLATSLEREGFRLEREQVAAAFLNALEPLWTEHAEGDPRLAVDRWRGRARFFGDLVRVRTASGEVAGIARALDDDGALVIEDAAGRRVRILAGDVDWPAAAGTASPSPARVAADLDPPSTRERP